MNDSQARSEVAGVSELFNPRIPFISNDLVGDMTPNENELVLECSFEVFAQAISEDLNHSFSGRIERGTHERGKFV